jgi:RimJ/RimL family protein N-acetyltransferase
MAERPDQDRIVTTERLILSPYAITDFPDSAGLWGDPEVTRFVGGQPSTETQSWARVLRNIGHWQALGFGFWMVRHRTTGDFVGEVGFGEHRRDIEPSLVGAAEMGWLLAPTARRQGFAAEAATAALAWAATRVARKITCMIDPQNAPSIRLALSLGFVQFAETVYAGAPVLLFARR